jgi:hypothetical protein
VFALLLLALAGPFVLALTLSLAASWLVPPRPSTRQLLRLRGARSVFAATGAVVAILALPLALYLIRSLGNQDPETPTLWIREVYSVYLLAQGIIGFVVLGAWYLPGKRKPLRNAPHWRDRFGRVLGFCWVVLFAMSLALLLFAAGPFSWFLILAFVAGWVSGQATSGAVGKFRARGMHL